MSEPAMAFQTVCRLIWRESPCAKLPAFLRTWQFREPAGAKPRPREGTDELRNDRAA